MDDFLLVLSLCRLPWLWDFEYLNVFFENLYLKNAKILNTFNGITSHLRLVSSLFKLVLSQLIRKVRKSEPKILCLVKRLIDFCNFSENCGNQGCGTVKFQFDNLTIPSQTGECEEQAGRHILFGFCICTSKRLSSN